jgi:hypothetical protein
MKKIICIVFSLCTINIAGKGQDNSFYAKGYLLNNKDTTWCKIWFNPKAPYFNDNITTWQNEEAKVISLENNKDLIGFGITEEGYQTHLGRIRVQGLNSWIFLYVKKVVTGVVELYEYKYTFVEKKQTSFDISGENFSAYYICRTDINPAAYPTWLKQLKKKKIVPFLKGFPELEKIVDEIMTPKEIADLLIQYNVWVSGKK